MATTSRTQAIAILKTLGQAYIQEQLAHAVSMEHPVAIATLGEPAELRERFLASLGQHFSYHPANIGDMPYHLPAATHHQSFEQMQVISPEAIRVHLLAAPQVQAWFDMDLSGKSSWQLYAEGFTDELARLVHQAGNDIAEHYAIQCVQHSVSFIQLSNLDALHHPAGQQLVKPVIALLANKHYQSYFFPLLTDTAQEIQYLTEQGQIYHPDQVAFYQDKIAHVPGNTAHLVALLTQFASEHPESMQHASFIIYPFAAESDGFTLDTPHVAVFGSGTAVHGEL